MDQLEVACEASGTGEPIRNGVGPIQMVTAPLGKPGRLLGRWGDES